MGNYQLIIIMKAAAMTIYPSKNIEVLINLHNITSSDTIVWNTELP